MILNNSGLTPPERLLEFLRSIHAKFDNKDELEFGIHTISNHKGNWEIEFREVPTLSDMMAVFTFFKTEQEWDNLSAIVFNSSTHKEQRFESLGSCGELNDFQIVHILSYVAIETEARADRARHKFF